VARITLTSAGTLGDHFPFLALGQELTRRGHNVRYAGPVYLRDFVEECGMQWQRARPELDPEQVKNKPESFDHWTTERGGHPATPPEDTKSDYYDRSGFENRVDDVLHACRDTDLLICSRLQLVGRTVSDLCGVPWISACIPPWLYPSPGTSAEKGIVKRNDPVTQSKVTRRYRDRIHQYRATRGLAPIPLASEIDLFESPRLLLATDPLFGEPQARPGRQIVQTGFWLHDRSAWKNWQPPEKLRRLLDQHPAPLVLAFSSQPLRNPAELLDLHLAAADRLGRALIAQAGWAALDSPAFRDACNRGTALTLEEGPQNWLFSQAGAVITHGGIGTTARALQAGTPLLMEPHGNDQFYNARQIIALSAGSAVHPHRMTSAHLARILQKKILLPKTRKRARALAEKMDSANALQRACHQIETWLKNPTPPPGQAKK
jgi:UDP:flavonoid glycosyltransferase YjiC (YdhE family)